ncbi:hypothetical protein [Opitutus sp. ER46]|uniref:hypothetical protein n=1 Tax=Opitutus sp. ER46 TaxID=2161864 RepID=UPI000D311431|nr:hypothetical protein [Opitutus sp. ER46]PTX97833.1 hypothetical protein DB354_06025 [Opitutus sp. ER46]
MDTAQRRISDSQASFRRFAGAFLYTILMVVSFAAPAGDLSAPPVPDRHSLSYFRHEMYREVRADHPAILPVAAAIRAITTDPLQQLAIVNDVTHLLVDYDDDQRIYQVEDFHASLDEMIARRRAGGWAYLRDDCDGRAVFAAHLLASLGIPWRFEASYWKEHAWVRARVNGTEYDLLDLRKNARETNRLSYKLVGHFFVRTSRPPPYFDWRSAWAAHTHRNLRVGLTLGMLTLDSTEVAMHPRHATDWTKLAPHDATPPLDDPRSRFAGVAGFPYGESLSVGLFADAPKPTPSDTGVSLGGSTGASSAPAADPVAPRH